MERKIHCVLDQGTDLGRLFAGIAGALRPGRRLIFHVLIHEGEPMNQRPWLAGPDWTELVEVSEA
jgi:hypothetical protein